MHLSQELLELYQLWNLYYYVEVRGEITTEGSPLCGVASMLDCDIGVREFKHQLYYYVHIHTNTFGKDMNSLSQQLWDI